MNKIELVQKIGNEVCEGCGPDADCGEDPKECFRVLNAVSWLDEYTGQSSENSDSICHKPMKDELITVTEGLKLSQKPNGTWLHFESSTGQMCTFCIESKFPSIGSKAIRQWAFDTIKSTALD